MDTPLKANVAAGSGAAMRDFTKPCHWLDASVALSKKFGQWWRHIIVVRSLRIIRQCRALMAHCLHVAGPHLIAESPRR